MKTHTHTHTHIYLSLGTFLSTLCQGKSTYISSSSLLHILQVEDISSNYLLISAMLSKHYNLLHAVNGEQAVAMVKEYKIDLLLMDMKMPVMDGLTATAEIRKFDTNIPIVALTAHAFESDKVAALKSGCNDYLVKPVDKARLMSVLRKYCHPSTLVL